MESPWFPRLSWVHSQRAVAHAKRNGLLSGLIVDQERVQGPQAPWPPLSMGGTPAFAGSVARPYT